MKKVIMILICILLGMSLNGCVDDKHMTDIEAEEYVKLMLDEECKFVKSYLKEDDKDRKVYHFKDSRNNEFTIVSELGQKNFDGVEYGKKIAIVYPNYVDSLIHSHKNELMSVLKKYDLLDKLLRDIFNARLDDLSDEQLIYFDVVVDKDADINKVLDKYSDAALEICSILKFNYLPEYIQENHQWLSMIFNCVDCDGEKVVWFKLNMDLTGDVTYSKEYILKMFNEYISY